MTLPAILADHENGSLVWDIADAADDRKGADIVILKVDNVSYLADFFVLVTGFSSTQVRAIADSVETALEEKYGKQPSHKAGIREGNWVLLDYSDVIVHIFLPEGREFYNLEAFWSHAERVEFEPALS